jgi:hypothetical protein
LRCCAACCGVLAYRGGEQVVEHLVWLWDARLRDPLHRGVYGGGRGAPTEGLRRDRYAACEAAGPLGSLRNLRQYGAAGFFQPASGCVQVRQDALTCQHRHRHDRLLWGRRRRQCHPRAHQCDPRVNVQILTGQPITDGIGRASRERPASEV